MAQIPANYRALDGSERRPAEGARLLGPADPNEEFSVTVRVRRRPDAPPRPDHAHWMATPPGKRTFITHDEFCRKYGATQEDLDAVANFAKRMGMTVTEVSAGGRTVVVSGSVEQMSQAFAVDLARYEWGKDTYRGRDGFIYVPKELAGIVVAVFGLDNRRVGFRNSSDPPGAMVIQPTLLDQAGQFYNFPQPPPDASSKIIGVVEFAGGGWTSIDIQATLTSWIAADTNPSVTDVPPSGNPGISDSETILDLCTASAVAPGAKMRVYWGNASSSAQDWFTVIDRIFHPKAGDPTPAPDVVSISYTLIGGDDFITPSGVVSTATINEISSDFQDMAMAGITVLVASGDGGSLGWNNSAAAPPSAHGKAHVAYPASDPWVTSCGGTATGLTASFELGQEWVWNDSTGATGGGISAFFNSLPAWQVGIVNQRSINDGISVGRGVPDVSGNASLISGYNISLNSPSLMSPTFSGPFCGTSAVAPLYAGLVAMIDARLGQNIGFLNPTLYAFDETICVDINDQLFPGSPPDNSFSGSPGYASGPGWDGCTGLGRIDGGALLAALQSVFVQDCRFILDRTEIGKDEVSETLTGSQPGVIANAFYVVVDGFNAAALGIVASDLSGTPAHNPTFSVAGVPAGSMSVAATALLAEDVSLPTTPQRFTWVCAAEFDPSLDAFQTPPALPKPVTLQATINGLTSPAVTVQLAANADPYELDGPTWWLSEDLRVFQVTTGGSLAGLSSVTLKNTGDPRVDAPTFIKAVIAGFNANTTPPPNHPFDMISTDEQASQVTLNQFNPSTSTTPVYNFGVARVRYESVAPSGLARVFFRIFQAATTSTAYASDTYGSVSNTSVSSSGKIPVFGVDGADNVVAIPCFADARVLDPTTLDQQADDTNVAFSGIPAGVSYMYFGCWLDINQPGTPNAVPMSPVAVDSANPWASGSQSVLAAITGKHQCLVAEISYDLDPVQAGETPASSDKLAQRNLAVVPSGNPGGALAHRVPHTFDIRPTPAALPAGAPPDELMIIWGNVPAGTLATIYLPSVSAPDVLALAAKMYTVRQFGLVDDHTLQCRTGGVTWMPVPQVAGANFAGLLTVDLPPTVRRGEAFTIVVRQVTNATVAAGQPTPGRPGFEEAITPSSERRVLGSFQISIPVSTEEPLLDSEESLLSLMRWIKDEKAQGDRWSPVLERYVAQIAERVQGFGGDPQKIPPSPTGNWYRPRDGYGSLVVTFVDHAGNPVDDIAYVFLQQFQSEDEREIRRWPTDAPLIVRDLHSTNTGIYELQVLPEHHKAAGRFVTIEDGRVTRVTLTLEPK
ncbi:MAG TPA: S53 family peptidase [Bryobacteraceae bacterium]|nr:S53 family peptidase [Bryobacteraceae bacterium]